MDLPPLETELYQKLRADIRLRGIQVPILVDSATGEVIDGRQRRRIAAELGIKAIPTIYVGRLDERDRADLRLAVNLYRRHLSRSPAGHRKTLLLDGLLEPSVFGGSEVWGFSAVMPVGRCMTGGPWAIRWSAREEPEDALGFISAMGRQANWIIGRASLGPTLVLADLLGRLFTACRFAPCIDFAEEAKARSRLGRIRAAHQVVERCRGRAIPIRVHRGVLRVCPLLRCPMTGGGRADLRFRRLGDGLANSDLPETYGEWTGARGR